MPGKAHENCVSCFQIHKNDQGTVFASHHGFARGNNQGARMKLKLDKTMIVLWLVVALSSASAVWMLAGGGAHTLDEGLVKAVKKLRF
jgi:hypothetical protein